MAERIIKVYRRLCEIRLLHHYWLDEEDTVFDLIPEQEKKDEHLHSYDFRSFLKVKPTVATAKELRNLGCVYKDTVLGCVVAVPDTAVLPDDANFEFLVTVQHPDFFNYTALTLRPQKIYELYYQSEDKIYRYKENMPVLSNLTGASRGTGPNKVLFLSKEIPALTAEDKVESIVLSGNSLLQLTSDQPGASTQLLNAIATKLPVFVHQGDVPATVPPNGLVGVPAHGIMLSNDIPDNVFALIRLSAIRPNDGDYSLVDNSGHAKSTSPVFQIRFKNRSTFWKYINKRTGDVKSIESDPLPLTHFGNAGTKQKPSGGLVKVVKSGTKIAKLVSEIYV